MSTPQPKLTLWQYCISAFIWTELIVTTAIFCMVLVIPLFLLMAPFDPKRRYVLPGVMRLWSRLLIRLSPLWKVKVEGTENLQEGQTYVIAPTHQSYGDIFVLGFVPNAYVFLSKSEIFMIPFAGWGMWLIGCVALRRGNKASARRAMQTCNRRLRNGVSVVVFPEGTRSPDGNLGPFKEGAFRLALETGYPILPVVIEGSRNMLPKGGYSFHQRADVTLRILPPISVEGRPRDDVQGLLQHTRETLLAAQTELRGRTAEPR